MLDEQRRRTTPSFTPKPFECATCCRPHDPSEHKLRPCQRCKRVYYCGRDRGRDCQVKHWICIIFFTLSCVVHNMQQPFITTFFQQPFQQSHTQCVTAISIAQFKSGTTDDHICSGCLFQRTIVSFSSSEA